ncbi:MAG: capsule assembly Wzi family protein [Candidatus Korobacteraceae bacterium]
MDRLHALGYVDTAFLGLRPWTRLSIAHMLMRSADHLETDTGNDEARSIYLAALREIQSDRNHTAGLAHPRVELESVYTILRGISGTSLRDSFHLGSTIVNDYGRPYESGFNSYSGFSARAEAGRFSLYFRGETQYAPSAAGYSSTLAQTLSAIDQITFLNPATGLPYNQPTIPLGPIGTVTQVHVLEAYVAAHALGQEFSFGKEDEWLGPGQGSAMAYSNNADGVYALHIDRTEPFRIPLLSRLTGPWRYAFLVGPLQGHTYVPGPPNSLPTPGDPWVHAEKFSFKPIRDLEFGFERTVIWGGKGHEPITLRTFLRSFFSTNSTDPTVKDTAQDPGARFSAFDFTYRLPHLHNWLTLYSDMEAHDAPSPIAKPPHGAFRPGLYLSHFPGVSKLDLRVEGVDTDSSVTNPGYIGSIGGLYQYWEQIQKQGYTNQGQLFGDWAGREAKGGQGWITYHLSADEWIQLGVRNQKVSKDFIPGGTTLNDIDLKAVKRIGNDLEIKGNFTYEKWKAPIYLPGQQDVTNTTIQLTWFPRNSK